MDRPYIMLEELNRSEKNLDWAGRNAKPVNR